MPGLLPRLDVVLKDVREEVISATQMHSQFHSPHEGYAVLLEEVDELWDEIKVNESGPRRRAEAIQIAAMAIRFILDLHGE